MIHPDQLYQLAVDRQRELIVEGQQLVKRRRWTSISRLSKTR